MKHQPDADTVEGLKAALAAGATEQQKALRERTRRTSRQTSWAGDAQRVRERTNMMGEGMGNAMGLEGPKYDTGWTVAVPEVEPDLEALAAERKVKRQESTAKAKRTRELNLARRAALKAAEEAGKVLRGKRVFMVTEAFEDFDVRAKRFGGIPEGVDVVATEFCNLVAVPVIEAEEGKKLGLTEAWKDPQGRPFWVPSDVVDHVTRVFGSVQWNRPLTKDEVETQFKVRFAD